MIAALVVHQYRARHPLMPVRQLATTFPATGILIAMCASAAAVGLMDLVLTSLQKSSPVHVALLFLPEFGAAVVTAALFGVTAFLVAPILLYLATAIGAGAASGLHAAIWICLCPAAAGGAGAVASGLIPDRRRAVPGRRGLPAARPGKPPVSRDTVSQGCGAGALGCWAGAP